MAYGIYGIDIQHGGVRLGLGENTFVQFHLDILDEIFELGQCILE